jgi:hypothetical protein
MSDKDFKQDINTKLRKVQLELKVPKDQSGRFGAYRSAERILEAVKPILGKYELTLTLSDGLENIGDRNYVKATASVCDSTGCVSVCAYAWEGEISRGLDASQVTGATSSYARKYALNGLFAIDDTKDADTNEHQSQSPRLASKPSKERTGAAGHATDAQRREVARVLTIYGYETPEAQKAKLESMGVKLPLTVGGASHVLDTLKGGDMEDAA